MRPINIFGRKISFKVETKKAEEKVVSRAKTKNIVFTRAIILALIFSFFALSNKIEFYRSRLVVGDRAKKTIVATINTSYKDETRKKEIIEELLTQVESVYTENARLKNDIDEKIINFFAGLRKISFNKYDDYVKNENLVLTKDELRTLYRGRKRTTLRNKIRRIISKEMEKGIRDNDKDMAQALERLRGSLNDLELKLVINYLKPNYLYNHAKTEEKLENQIANLKDIVVKVKAGEIIIKRGDIINKQHIDKLNSIGLYSYGDNIQKFLGYLLYLVVISFIFTIVILKYLRKELAQKKYYYLTLILTATYMLVLRLINLKYVPLFPMESLTILFGVLISVRYSAILSSFLLIYHFVLTGFDFTMFIVLFSSMIFSIYTIGKIKNRTDIINSGVYIGMLKLIVGIAGFWIWNAELVDTVLSGSQLFFSGLLSAMLVIALLPYAENTFNILTKMKLIELGDLSHPLLRKMSIESPGTFHHSILVATLSERAAEAIGADSTFVRVAAYYHDIGKMKRPSFYVENQNSRVNRHEGLSPTLSTLIIKAHTKDGWEMGKEYGIPKEIRDIMVEHQGTTLLAYFYNKAKMEDSSVNELDFRYDGPKPRSKESAIIMMADSIEAAVRSLDEKDAISIEKMIRNVITAKMNDAQFSESDLTFKEIETIIMTFVKVFRAIYHERIKYPDQKKENKE